MPFDAPPSRPSRSTPARVRAITLRSRHGLLGIIPPSSMNAGGTHAHLVVRLILDGIGEVAVALMYPVDTFQARLNMSRSDQPVRDLRQWIEGEAYTRAITENPALHRRRVLEAHVRWKNLHTGRDEPFLR